MEMVEEHCQFYKMSMYEACAHDPLLMVGPGIKANLQVPNVLSLGDIHSTMFDIITGISLPLSLEPSAKIQSINGLKLTIL